MNRSTPADALSPLMQPLRRLTEWFRRQAEANMLASLDPEDSRRLADDLKVSVADLEVAVRQSPDERSLLEKMLALHGLDADKVAHAMPGLLREITLTCAHCADKGQCHHAFENGLTAEQAATFCPNAETMREVAKA